jgi:RNA polymerase sigma-70 factor, ECF subfamily
MAYIAQVTMPTLINPDETSTLVAAARRDPAQFAALYDRYVEKIYHYLYGRVGSTVEAEDLTSQTFVAALEALPRYQDKGYFSTWLFAIARSKVMDHFRQRKHAPLDENLAENPEILAHVSRSDEIRRLSGLVRALAEDERELIYLRYVADLSFAEMAALLGKGEEAVKKSLYRLLARMQGQME